MTLKVTTPSTREIALTRVFDAPRRRVFDAYTKLELLKRWLLGPPGIEAGMEPNYDRLAELIATQ